jgi:hypothetical protein
MTEAKSRRRPFALVASRENPEAVLEPKQGQEFAFYEARWASRGPGVIRIDWMGGRYLQRVLYPNDRCDVRSLLGRPLVCGHDTGIKLSIAHIFNDYEACVTLLGWKEE